MRGKKTSRGIYATTSSWHGTTQEAREKCLNAASGRTAIRQVERVLKRKLTVS